MSFVVKAQMPAIGQVLYVQCLCEGNQVRSARLMLYYYSGTLRLEQSCLCGSHVVDEVKESCPDCWVWSSILSAVTGGSGSLTFRPHNEPDVYWIGW